MAHILLPTDFSDHALNACAYALDLFGGAPPQAGQWEATVGVIAANSSDVDFDGGTTAAIDSGFGFMAGAGYHFTDRLRFG